MMRFVLLISLIVFGNGCRISANFHEVEKGKFYRSATLTAEELTLAIEKIGIKTIINLRGSAVGKKWYEDEVRVANEHNVKLISIGMSASRTPSREKLLAIVAAYRDEQYPILIHCKAGADRSRLATAIYLFDEGVPKRKAKKALAAKYYHFKKFTPAMDYFFEQYLGSDWALLAYFPCEDNYKYFDHKDCPAIADEPIDLAPSEDEDT